MDEDPTPTPAPRRRRATRRRATMTPRRVPGSGRAPEEDAVEFWEDDWPPVARSGPGRDDQSWIFVRRHQDGRFLVYGGNTRDRKHPGAQRAGEELPAGASRQDVVEAIIRVCNDGQISDRARDTCINALPPRRI